MAISRMLLKTWKKFFGIPSRFGNFRVKSGVPQSEPAKVEQRTAVVEVIERVQRGIRESISKRTELEHFSGRVDEGWCEVFFEPTGHPVGASTLVDAQLTDAVRQ